MDELLEHYDYDLPERLIAQDPIADRAASRLLVLDRSTGEIQHLHFRDIFEFVRPDDLWVFNDTRVFPARMFAHKDTGARIELLFLERHGDSTPERGIWSALCRPGRRLAPGAELFAPEPDAPFCRIVGKAPDGVFRVELLIREPIFDFLDRHGETPLPPYIKKKLNDRDRYQTVYAQCTGSAAAPTAGFHFTPALRGRLADTAQTARVTLHIGLDTFRPVSAHRISDHVMHTEAVTVPRETAEAVCACKSRGGRVAAVGTTSVRSIESWAGAQLSTHGELAPAPYQARTDLFIHRGYTFRAVDVLLTNFHLPRSTLLIMICAFAERDNVLRAYHEAVEREYRFYSFGDAMLIV